MGSAPGPSGGGPYMESIGRSINSALQLSKRGGGVALLLSNIREHGAPIKKIENQSSGVIPIMFQRSAEEPRSPVITVDVPDIDAVLAKIEQLGGATVVKKMPIAEMGFAAYFRDPEGNVLGLWETAASGG